MNGFNPQSLFLFFLTDVTEKFIEYVRFEKRYSPHTVTAYESDLSQFYHFLKNQYSIEDISDVDHLMIRSWLVVMMEQGVSERSINRKLTTLKSYYRFLIKSGVVEVNPMNRITSLKTSKRLPVYLEQEKIDLMFDKVDFGEGYPAIRNRLILEMLYSTGMRLAELVNLKEHDIDFQYASLKCSQIQWFILLHIEHRIKVRKYYATSYALQQLFTPLNNFRLMLSS